VTFVPDVWLYLVVLITIPTFVGLLALSTVPPPPVVPLHLSALMAAAAFAQPTGSPRSPRQQYIHASAAAPTQHRLPRPGSKQRFMAELSQCLFEFVIQLLPTAEEMAVKEDVRKLLERLIRNIEPESRLLSFGSTANGFSLRNSGTARFEQPFNGYPEG
jgi:hypothetical protein